MENKRDEIEKIVLVEDLIVTLRMAHEIEIRDNDGYRLFTCPSNSLALEPYLTREVIDWFASEMCKVVISIGEGEEY